MELVCTDESPVVEIEVNQGKGKTKEKETIGLVDFIDVKGWKAQGNRLSTYKVKKVILLPSKDKMSENEKEVIRKRENSKSTNAETDEQRNKQSKKSLKAQNIPTIDKKSKKGTEKGKESFGIGTTIELDF